MNEVQSESTRRIQQLGGLFILLLSLGFIVWTWWTAFFEGYYYLKASFIFPPFFFIGLGLLLFPDYKTERIKRGEDVSQLEGLKLLTPRWWAILIIGLLAGLGNYLLIQFIWNQ